MHVSPPQQVGSDIAQIGAAFSRAQHESVTGRRCAGEMIEAAMVTRFAFACNEGVDVCGNPDLCAAIVATHMSRKQIGAVENAHLPRIGLRWSWVTSCAVSSSTNITEDPTA